MLMQDESDWLMRQLHAFATGLGYTLSRHKGGTTEVVFPQDQDQPLPHQVELAQLIDRRAYAQAAQRLLALNSCSSEFGFMRRLINLTTKVSLPGEFHEHRWWRDWNNCNN